MSAWTVIAHTEVGSGGATDIIFSSIAGTYTDLCLMLSGRATGSNATGDMFFEFNDSGSNFSYRHLYGNGSSAVSASYSGIYGRDLSAATATANTFGSAEAYIPNYAGNTNKSLSVDTAGETNATTTLMSLAAGLWSNTAAITSVNLTTDGNFVQYSTAYLYGIKNS